MVAELQQIMQNRGMKDVEIALAVSGISGRRTTLIAELTEKELMTLMSETFDKHELETQGTWRKQ